MTSLVWSPSPWTRTTVPSPNFLCVTRSPAWGDSSSVAGGLGGEGAPAGSQLLDSLAQHRHPIHEWPVAQGNAERLVEPPFGHAEVDWRRPARMIRDGLLWGGRRLVLQRLGQARLPPILEGRAQQLAAGQANRFTVWGVPKDQQHPPQRSGGRPRFPLLGLLTVPTGVAVIVRLFEEAAEIL